MSRFKIISLSVLLLLVTISCNQRNLNREFENGKVVDGLYTSYDFGWTIQIPEGWKITPQSRLDMMQQMGNNMTDEATDIEIDASGVKYLICFHNGFSDMFLSTSEPLGLGDEGEWDEHLNIAHQVTYQAYHHQGFEVDTISSMINIDDLNFDLFKVEISKPKEDFKLRQEFYSTWLEGKKITIIVTYSNEENRETLIDALMNSTFSN